MGGETGPVIAPLLVVATEDHASTAWHQADRAESVAHSEERLVLKRVGRPVVGVHLA